MKLWGGRFSAPPADALDRLGKSVHFDRRLHAEEIRVNQAYARALAAAGVLSCAELDRMLAGLDRVGAVLAAAAACAPPEVADEPPPPAAPYPAKHAGLPTAEPASAGMSVERLARIRPAVQAYVDDGRLAGVMTLVARRGQVVHWDAVGLRDVEAADPLEPDDIFRIYR